jgi:hypothetical protein
VLFLIVTLCGASPGRGQVPDTGLAHRVLTKLVDKLNRDAALPDSLRHWTVADLLSGENLRFVAWLDDASAALFMRATAITEHQVPSRICGDVTHNATPGLDVMLPYVDRGAMNKWSDVLERIVRTRAKGAAVPRAASDSEVRATMEGIPTRLNVADRARFNTIANGPPPDQADGCWAIRVVMDGLAALPRGKVGPVVRTLFGRAAPPPHRHR